MLCLQASELSRKQEQEHKMDRPKRNCEINKSSLQNLETTTLLISLLSYFQCGKQIICVVLVNFNWTGMSTQSRLSQDFYALIFKLFILSIADLNISEGMSEIWQKVH